MFPSGNRRRHVSLRPGGASPSPWHHTAAAARLSLAAGSGHRARTIGRRSQVALSDTFDYAAQYKIKGCNTPEGQNKYPNICAYLKAAGKSTTKPAKKPKDINVDTLDNHGGFVNIGGNGGIYQEPDHDSSKKETNPVHVGKRLPIYVFNHAGEVKDTIGKRDGRVE